MNTTHLYWCPKCGRSDRWTKLTARHYSGGQRCDGVVERREYVAVDALLSDKAHEAARDAYRAERDFIEHFGATEADGRPLPLEAALSAAVAAVRAAEHPTTETKT